MNFEEALEKLKQGFKIRRPFFIEEGGEVFYRSVSAIWLDTSNITFGDVLAEDWEISE